MGWACWACWAVQGLRPSKAANAEALWSINSKEFRINSLKLYTRCPNKFWIYKLQNHTVRNLHFLSKNSTLISRENCRFFFGWKTRENVAVLGFLAVDNFDFTRKIIKKNLGEKLVKRFGFCQNWIFGQKFDF